MSRKSVIAVRGDLLKVAAFVVLGVLVLALLGAQLSGYRFTAQQGYHAEFTDTSALRSGDEVQIAGVVVGKVSEVRLRDGDPVVDFAVDDAITLPGGTQAKVRYKNLLGDRYLELRDGPGETDPLQVGGVIPAARTEPAMDLDLLLNGFQPLFEGLDPGQINQLSGTLIQVLQGQGGTIEQLLADVAALSGTLADKDEVIGSVIDHMNTVLGEVNARDEQFSQTLVKLQRLVSGLAEDREEIGSSLTKVASITGSFAGLLRDARPGLRDAVAQFNRALGAVEKKKETLSDNLAALPRLYARVSRIGTHGAFTNVYLCGLRLKLSGPDGSPVYTPTIGSNSATERCKDPQ